jgi:hypothetical protein
MLRVCTLLFICLAAAPIAQGDGWSKTVEVRDGSALCVSYRAKLQGKHLVVEASHGESWHTYAMDNKRRAADQLDGRKSLGIEMPTCIELDGLPTVGPWYQSRPTDLSQPKLRWFTWGFQGESYFAVQVKSTDAPELKVSISGQVCNSESCRMVGVDLLVPASDKQADKAVDLDSLVRVRKVAADQASQAQ